MKIPVLILAAGASSRMGSAKQLLPWGNTTLLENAIEAAIGAKSEHIYVVLGANSEKIKKRIIGNRAIFLDNDLWESGMGSSIKTGIYHITKKQHVNGVLIMLADQPLIDSEYLDEMINRFKGNEKSIVATGYKNKFGVPALFDAFYFKELLQLNEDFGAKALIMKHKDKVIPIHAHEKATDIDTVQDYNEIIHKFR